MPVELSTVFLFSFFLSVVRDLSPSRSACGMVCGLAAVCLFLRSDVKLKAE